MTNKELKDNELKKVNGGFGTEEEVVITQYKLFTEGDCFQDGNVRLKVKHDYRIPVDKPEEIEVYLTNPQGNSCYETHFSSNYIMFSERYYRGNNVW